jgi:hypothetical protein
LRIENRAVPQEEAVKQEWLVRVLKPARRQGVKNKPQTSRVGCSVLRQVCELIPPHLVPKLARETNVDGKCRSFSAWSHVVALVQAQLSHALSLNDVCDALGVWRTPLRAIRGATPPSRNALSHANRERNWQLAERLFWEVHAHLHTQFPCFAQGQRPEFAWRFRRPIHLVDATVIPLVVNCLDWAKHRRRKAAAKCHVRLGLRTLLPSFAVVDAASEHELTRAPELCAGLKDGEIAVLDKGYLDFDLLHDLHERGVCFVTRAKETQRYRTLKRRKAVPERGIIADEEIKLELAKSEEKYPARLRLVTARVELDGEVRELRFLTNNLQWEASSIADLYRSRWQIEAFFKQIKQNLQLADFLGHNANAVKWQVWIALLVYLLLRFIAWQHQWACSFSRLLTLLRTALWSQRSVGGLLRSCGTASGHFQWLDGPVQSELPQIFSSPVGQPN